MNLSLPCLPFAVVAAARRTTPKAALLFLCLNLREVRSLLSVKRAT
jgi:hypothetical protein